MALYKKQATTETDVLPFETNNQVGIRTVYVVTGNGEKSFLVDRFLPFPTAMLESLGE